MIKHRGADMSLLTNENRTRQSETPQIEPRAGSAKKQRALVVDADSEMLAFAAEALHSFAPGFDVATARDPQQALAWLETFPPDLLLTDLVFESDGAGALRGRLRADRRN